MRLIHPSEPLYAELPIASSGRIGGWLQSMVAHPLQITKNWAFRPVIAVAGIGQLPQGVTHRSQLDDFPRQFGDMFQRKLLHGPAGFFALPKPDQQFDPRHRQPEITCPPDKSQGSHIGIGIDPVASLGA